MLLKGFFSGLALEVTWWLQQLHTFNGLPQVYMLWLTKWYYNLLQIKIFYCRVNFVCRRYHRTRSPYSQLHAVAVLNTPLRSRTFKRHKGKREVARCLIDKYIAVVATRVARPWYLNWPVYGRKLQMQESSHHSIVNIKWSRFFKQFLLGDGQ